MRRAWVIGEGLDYWGGPRLWEESGLLGRAWIMGRAWIIVEGLDYWGGLV